MERVTSKLIEWKAVYDDLASAQNALLLALRSRARDEEIEALRRKIDGLHAQSEAALKALDQQVAEFRRRSSATPH
jgi:hypothetical protein